MFWFQERFLLALLGQVILEGCTGGAHHGLEMLWLEQLLLDRRLRVLSGEPLSGELLGGSPTNLTLFRVNKPPPVPPVLQSFPASVSVLQTLYKTQSNKNQKGKSLLDFSLPRWQGRRKWGREREDIETDKVGLYLGHLYGHLVASIPRTTTHPFTLKLGLLKTYDNYVTLSLSSV